MNDGVFLNLQTGDGTPVGTGFLGAILIGFFVGHMAVQLKKIK
jgi:fructose-specific phosphotransferase system IIC component